MEIYKRFKENNPKNVEILLEKVRIGVLLGGGMSFLPFGGGLSLFISVGRFICDYLRDNIVLKNIEGTIKKIKK